MVSCTQQSWNFRYNQVHTYMNNVYSMFTTAGFTGGPTHLVALQVLVVGLPPFSEFYLFVAFYLFYILDSADNSPMLLMSSMGLQASSSFLQPFRCLFFAAEP